jgi:1-acyl-sn-glycerol-3-phosphate acyltransferase
MVTLSYSAAVKFLRTIPICPKPVSKGLENIPKNEPVIYVYNHIILRVEPVWMALGAPTKPGIRFLADFRLSDPKNMPILKRDIRASVFTQKFQKKASRFRLTAAAVEKAVDILARFVMAQMKRIDVIVANLDYPIDKDEISSKFKTNLNALKKCVRCLKKDIPIAIAPSGGKTYEEFENPVYNTTIPTLASRLYNQGKVVKIVPSIIKEKPVVDQSTYWHYVLDRIIFYKIYRQILNFFRIKSYKKPTLTIEFLPPLTFEKENPTKSEKVDFIKNLLQIIYDNLKK